MVKWSVARAAVVLAVCGASGGCPFLGDHFFEATGRVVDCTALSPVAGATIAMYVDRGNSPGPYSPGVAYTTSATGQFDVHSDLTPDSWVTLTFQKTGYTALSHQFQGVPNAPAELCMMPSTDP